MSLRRWDFAEERLCPKRMFFSCDSFLHFRRTFFLFEVSNFFAICIFIEMPLFLQIVQLRENWNHNVVVFVCEDEVRVVN
jgi:hypothetical protein